MAKDSKVQYNLIKQDIINDKFALEQRLAEIQTAKAEEKEIKQRLEDFK